MSRRFGCIPLLALGTIVALLPEVYGQGRGGGRGGAQPAGPPPTPKAAATVDLTGYWVTLVTEDWRWRMKVPDKGDVSSIPFTNDPAKRAVLDAWDLWTRRERRTKRWITN